MGKRMIALAAFGFVQTAGLADRVLAQKVFGDDFCQPTIPPTQCFDSNNCIGRNPPFSQCENTIGVIDFFRCNGGPNSGNDCTKHADCPGGACLHAGQIADVDGCLCIDHSLPPPKCAVVHGLPQGTCVNVDCVNMGMVCDPVSCSCVPGLPSTTTTTTTVTTMTTTSTTPRVVDHLKCYKVRDSLALSGVVDLDSKQFGLEADCKIMKATKFCVPVTKTVDEANVDVIPFPGQNLVGDYVCYKIKCTTNVPDTKVRDQFGTRTLTKFKAFELCGPAIKVP